MIQKRQPKVSPEEMRNAVSHLKQKADMLLEFCDQYERVGTNQAEIGFIMAASDFEIEATNLATMLRERFLG